MLAPRPFEAPLLDAPYARGPTGLVGTGRRVRSLPWPTPVGVPADARKPVGPQMEGSERGGSWQDVWMALRKRCSERQR